jgi:Protein of unknown function (DUF1595)
LGETPSRRKIVVCHPAGGENGGSSIKLVAFQGAGEEEACARKILSAQPRRAYRRPVAEEDIQPLLKLYRTSRSQAGFGRGIRAAQVVPAF